MSPSGLFQVFSWTRTWNSFHITRACLWLPSVYNLWNSLYFNHIKFFSRPYFKISCFVLIICSAKGKSWDRVGVVLYLKDSLRTILRSEPSAGCLEECGRRQGHNEAGVGEQERLSRLPPDNPTDPCHSQDPAFHSTMKWKQQNLNEETN